MADQYDGEIKLHVSLESDDVIKQAKDIQKEIKVVVDKVGDDVSKETKEIVDEIQEVSKDIDKELDKLEKKTQKRKPRKQPQKEENTQEKTLEKEKQALVEEIKLQEKAHKEKLAQQQEQINAIKSWDKSLRSYADKLRQWENKDISYIPASKDVEESKKVIKELRGEITKLQEDINLDDIDSILQNEDSIKRINDLLVKLRANGGLASKTVNDIQDALWRSEVESIMAEKQRRFEERAANQKEAAKNLLVTVTDEDGVERKIKAGQYEEEQAQRLKTIEEQRLELQRQIEESEQRTLEAELATEEAEREIQQIREEIYTQQLQESERIIGLVDSALTNRDGALMEVANPEGLAELYGEMEGIYEYYIHLMEMREQAFNVGEEDTRALDIRIQSTEEQIQSALDEIELFLLESKRIPQETEQQTGKIAGLINKAKILYTKLRGLPQQLPKIKQHLTNMFNTIKKMGVSISKLGLTTSKTTGKMQNSFKNLFRNILKYGIGITTLVMLFNKLRTTVKEDFKLMAEDIPELGKQMDSLKSSLELFKHSLGSAFEPIANIAIPYLTKLLDYLASFLDLLGQVSAAIFGQKQYAKAVKKTTQELQEGEKAAKGYLSPIDTIHQYSTDKGSGSGSGGGSGVFTMEDVSTEAIGIAEKFQEFVDKVATATKPFRDALKQLWDEGLSKLANFTWTALKDFYENFLVPIGKWAFGEDTGLTRLVKIINEFLNKIDWERLNESLKNFWKAIEPYAEQFGEGLIDFFEDVLTFVRENIIDKLPDWLDKLTETLNNGDPKKARKWGYAFGIVLGAFGVLKLIGGVGTISKVAGAIWKLKWAIGALVAIDIGWRAGNGLYELLTGEHIDKTPLEQFKEIMDSFTDGTYKDGLDGLATSWIDFSDWIIMGIYNMLDPLLELFSYLGGPMGKTVYDAYKARTDKFRADYDERHGYKRDVEFDENNDAAQKTRQITLLYMERNELVKQLAALEEQLGPYDPTKTYSGDEYALAIQRLQEIDTELGNIKITQKEVSDSAVELGSTMNTQYEVGNASAYGLTKAIEYTKGTANDLTKTVVNGSNTMVNKNGEVGNSFSNVNPKVEHLDSTIDVLINNANDGVNTLKATMDTDLSEEVFNQYGTNMQTGVVDNGMQPAVDSINQLKEDTFSEDAWNMDGVSTGLDKSFGAGLELVKNGWKTFSEWLEKSFILELLPGVSPVITESIKNAIGGNTVSLFKIPKLAQGGVIPPNKQFLAMLGDQKNGTNIEAPLDTIKQAVKEVLNTNGKGNGTVTVNLTLDRRVLAQAVVAEGKVIKATSNENIFNF